MRVLDRTHGAVSELAPADCGFTYRSSAFKREPGRWVVLAVRFVLRGIARSAPIRYPELARALGVELGARAPLADVREAVLALRRGKGMVLDPGDPDTASAGSFFTNPVLDATRSRRLSARAGAEPRRLARRPTGTSRPRPRGSSSAPAFTAATATRRASRSRPSTRSR